MSTPHELEQLKRRLDSLERELGETRRELTALERRAAVEAFVAARPPEAAPVAPPPLPAPAPTPPPLAEPAPAAHAEARGFRPAGPETSPVRDWLRRLQLWPPEAEAGGAEARLGAWWATRFGTLLAVVGVVFFGIYVSLHTPPWVKFLELVAVALGVSGLGLWLERRVAAFGSVVFAGGLALLFFAAYAGHALPGVRVFESLLAGVVAQTVAVGVVVAAALWRRSAGVATLAIGLGYVTAFVSDRGGLEGYALGAAGTLGVVAVALRRWRGWEGPSVVAMPAAYAIFALGLEAAHAAGAECLPAGRWIVLVALATLFFLRDWRNKTVDTTSVSTGEKIFHNANSGLALLCGLAAALGWARGDLEVFYFGAAAWCAVAAWLRARQVRGGDVVAAVLTAKAAGALTLGVIEVADARSAALALLVQAWVLAWTASRIGSRVLAACAGLTAVVATGYFFAHNTGAAWLWSAEAAGAVLFALGLAALAVEGGRWLVADERGRRVVAVVGAAAGAWAFVAASANWAPAGWTPAVWMGGALGFGMLAWARRSGWVGAVAGGLAMLANLALWCAIAKETGWNALIVITPTVLAGCLPVLGRWRTFAWCVATISTGVVLFELVSADIALGLAGLLAAGLVATAPLLKGRHLPWLATLLAGLTAWLWVSASMKTMTPWVWSGFGLIWLLPVALRRVAALDAVRREERDARLMEGVLVVAGAVLGLFVVIEAGGTEARVLSSFVALAAATGLAAWRGRVAAAGWALLPLGLVVFTTALLLSHQGGDGVESPDFWAVLSAGLVLVALPLRPSAAATRWPRRVARILGALAAVTVLFSLAHAQRGALEPYVTVGWGGAAILLFMAGLFRRALSYRLIGLLALVPCVARVFLVDLHSTLHRIAAFIALGLVFLWVGFSYHRFRHLLVASPKDANSDSPSL